MGCDALRDADGNILGHVCIRGRQRRVRVKCIVCKKRPAQRLCDHELAEDEFRFNGQTSCDAPLCRRCTTPGPADTDYCPLHKESGAQLGLFGDG